LHQDRDIWESGLRLLKSWFLLSHLTMDGLMASKNICVQLASNELQSFPIPSGLPLPVKTTGLVDDHKINDHISHCIAGEQETYDRDARFVLRRSASKDHATQAYPIAVDFIDRVTRGPDVQEGLENYWNVRTPPQILSRSSCNSKRSPSPQDGFSVPLSGRADTLQHKARNTSEDELIPFINITQFLNTAMPPCDNSGCKDVKSAAVLRRAGATRRRGSRQGNKFRNENCAAHQGLQPIPENAATHRPLRTVTERARYIDLLVTERARLLAHSSSTAHCDSDESVDVNGVISQNQSTASVQEHVWLHTPPTPGCSKPVSPDKFRASRAPPKPRQKQRGSFSGSSLWFQVASLRRFVL